MYTGFFAAGRQRQASNTPVAAVAAATAAASGAATAAAAAVTAATAAAAAATATREEKMAPLANGDLIQVIDYDGEMT